MKKRTNLVFRYAVFTIAFLVIVLTFLLFISTSYNKNTAHLVSTVNELSKDYSEEQKIDDIISLLYIAENNTRMYILFNDTTYLSRYTTQLNAVEKMIQLLDNDSNKNNLPEQIKDKELKTQLYLKAKVIIDSLILIEDNIKLVPQKMTEYSLPPKIVTQMSVDTAGQEATPKKKKGFFSRIGKAIKNQQDTVILHTSIHNYRTETTVQQHQNGLILSTSGLQAKQKLFNDLKNKERNLLESNSKLFQTLQNLLQQLKQKERIAEQQKDIELSKKAGVFTRNLKSDDNYIMIFSILLSFIIVTILFFLYRSELKLEKVKEESEKYTQLRNSFIATVSHEIRNSIFSIESYADELIHVHNPARQSEALNAIKVSSGMLQEIVNNVLDLSKIEQGKFQFKSHPFNPKNVITEMLVGFVIHAQQKNLSTHSMIDKSTDCTVYGDAFYLRQILLNLLNNALKYTQKGSITIEANMAPSTDKKVLLHITISDTGVGISEKSLPHIFEVFNTQQDQTDVMVSSSGLGLNIVKKIVDLQNGAISVTSKVNEGSTFSLTIPYTIEKEITATVTKKQINSAKELKILLVENDKISQVFLSQMLSRCGYTFQMLDNAETALQWLDNNLVDLILTDMELSKINGSVFAQKIKKLGNSNARVPIFCITGYKENEIDVPENLFNEWLVKPFKSEELLQKIKDYFEITS